MHLMKVHEKEEPFHFCGFRGNSIYWHSNLSRTFWRAFLWLDTICFLCRINTRNDHLVMILKWAFRYFSESTKIDYLKDQGIMLGSRVRQGRKVYLYMLRDFFVEVIYQHDDIDMTPEKVKTFTSINNLNSYLERDFRSAF